MLQHEELQGVDMTSQEADEKLTTIVESIASRDRGQRLDARTHDTHVNEQKVTRWVKGAGQTAFLPLDVPVHPRKRAAHLMRQRAKWCNKLLEVAPPRGEDGESAMRTMAGKAAGASQWRAEDMLCRTWSFWATACTLWQTILDAGRIPDQWRIVRVVEIPRSQRARDQCPFQTCCGELGFALRQAH